MNTDYIYNSNSKNFLAGIKTKNMSCTPKFLKSYPQYTVNHTSWCQDKEIDEIIGDVYQNNCSTPCSSIVYEHSMEPFHGVEALNSEFCGEPSIILNFVMNKNVIVIKVRAKKDIFGIFSRMIFLQEEFVMGWDDLLSSVGGALGLWLGFSVISIGGFFIQAVGRIGQFKIFERKWFH